MAVARCRRFPGIETERGQIDQPGHVAQSGGRLRDYCAAVAMTD
jgi:hypothetical protein